MRDSTRCVLLGSALLALTACDGEVVERDFEGPVLDAPQAFQPPQNCEPCHPRQYAETLQSVMSGYRAISPLMNSLEFAVNSRVQFALELGAIKTNLRPVYGDSTGYMGREGEDAVRTNNISSTTIENGDQMRAAFCIGCHNPALILLGENPETREIPEWEGRQGACDPSCNATQCALGICFRKLENARPLRDYHFVEAKPPATECDYGNYFETCQQVLPATPGGPPPPGSKASLGSFATTCDTCHNARGPAERSLQGDGFANAALEICVDKDENGRCVFGRVKVGPFDDAVPIGPLEAAGEDQVFHGSSVDPDEISYLRSSEFCITCHDVRVPIPNGNLFVPEGNPGIFRLENLGTEWKTLGYGRADGNPFNQVVRCQDCHQSLYPYAGDTTYEVTDAAGRSYPVTSPTPAVFPTANVGSANREDVISPDRPVVTHQMTGIDVPLLSDAELRARLGDDRPSSCHENALAAGTMPAEDVEFCNGEDAFGVPNSIDQRRRDLLKASARLYLDKTENAAALGETFNLRVTAVALTGHNFPAGFSQERTAWLQVIVSAKQRGSNEDFVLYQSGYQVDKPHPETGEMAPDGRFGDEDLEHLNVIVNPFSHNNEVFHCGPDAGPLERSFEGETTGLVLFRNELFRLFGPPYVGVCPPLAELDPNNLPSTCRPSGLQGIPGALLAHTHPRTGEEISPQQPDGTIEARFLEEETFSAGLANGVDNWRALPPLDPRTYRYEVELPSAAELAELGVELEGELKIRTAIHFQHFPPLFLRFLARTSGSVPYQLPPESERVPGFSQDVHGQHPTFIGKRGQQDMDLNMIDEKRIDDFHVTIRDIAVAERSVPLRQ